MHSREVAHFPPSYGKVKVQDKNEDKDKYEDTDRVPGCWVYVQLIFLKMFWLNLSPPINLRKTRLHFLHTPDKLKHIIVRIIVTN